MKIEPYWGYMDKILQKSNVVDKWDINDILKKEIFELQKSLQTSLRRQRELIEKANDLERKIVALSEGIKQREMDL